jgi:adenine/guanine phosphoribosyltransferase-like PRPP-binding protein
VVVGASFLIELAFLDGRRTLEDLRVETILRF